MNLKGKEIVIARFSESLEHFPSSQSCIIYNKGPSLNKPESINKTLPNVGKEPHTYLHHIISNWESLADITLFTQAQIREYLPHSIPLDALFDSAYDFVTPWLVRLRQYDEYGDLRFGGVDCEFRKTAENGHIRKSSKTMAEWFRDELQINIMTSSGLVYSPGAIFSVSRDLIKSRDIEFYNRLFRYFVDAKFPEECWFIEQAWLYIFNADKARVKTLFKPDNPNAVFVQ